MTVNVSDGVASDSQPFDLVVSPKTGAIVINEVLFEQRFGVWEEFVEVYTGLSRDAAVWLAKKGVVNIGIDSLAIDHSDDLEFSGHMVCAEYQIVNTENLHPLAHCP